MGNSTSIVKRYSVHLAWSLSSFFFFEGVITAILHDLTTSGLPTLNTG